MGVLSAYGISQTHWTLDEMQKVLKTVTTRRMDINKIKIIDSHAHVGKWGKQTFYGKTIDPFKGQERDSFEKIQAFLKKQQIDRAVLVPTYCPDPTAAFKTNFTLVEYAEKAKGKIIPGFWVDPSPGVQHLLSETINFAMEKKIRVLKTSADAWADQYSPDPSTWDSILTRNMEKILEYARSKHAVFQIHTGSGKSDIRVIEKLIYFAGPGITFHLVHMGNNVSGHFYLIPRFAKWLSENLDVVCDTSCAYGFAVRWMIREALKNPEIANRILFASDEPWGVFEAELSKILHANGINQEITQKVLWKNSDRLYQKWEPLV